MLHLHPARDPIAGRRGVIAELIAGGVGLAAIAGLAVYAIRSVRVYADRALAELEARRVADVSTATMAGDLRIADANTDSFRRAAERQAQRAAALEEYARNVRTRPVPLDPDADGVDAHDVLLSALDEVASLAPPVPVRAGGDRGAPAGADRLPIAGGPGAGGGAGDAEGPATVPGG